MSLLNYVQKLFKSKVPTTTEPCSLAGGSQTYKCNSIINNIDKFCSHVKAPLRFTKTVEKINMYLWQAQTQNFNFWSNFLIQLLSTPNNISIFEIILKFGCKKIPLILHKVGDARDFNFLYMPTGYVGKLFFGKIVLFLRLTEGKWNLFWGTVTKPTGLFFLNTNLKVEIA